MYGIDIDREDEDQDVYGNENYGNGVLDYDEDVVDGGWNDNHIANFDRDYGYYDVAEVQKYQLTNDYDGQVIDDVFDLRY